MKDCTYAYYSESSPHLLHAHILGRAPFYLRGGGGAGVFLK